MAIDFTDMLDDDDEAVIHPRDIFFTLDKDPGFSFPRDIQTEVMNLWFEARDSKDNVIKLNVGSGKTLVGLLLLQSSLNEGVGPALYVAPDKQLAQQVISEAEALGLDVTDDPRDSAYESGEKICIINVYKLFNGRSVFGVDGSGQKIKIGAVIIDDAHACVSTVAEQFRIALPSQSSAFEDIFSTLEQDLKSYNHAKFLDVKAGDPRAFMEVPFWSWKQHNVDILKILHAHREDDELCFTYPLLKEILSYCRCIISGQKLEIEPPFPATDLISSFRQAKRRIYMTATLSDDSVMVTHFGADPQKLNAPIVPSSSQSMGERMILMPQELNSDLTVKDIRDLLKDLAEEHNVVVIVPSAAAAEGWKNDANQILLGEDVVPGVAKLREGHVGLTVLINRYDGIDLPGSACRVLAIVDLPEVSSYSQTADEAVLSNSSQGLRRQMERIEQGMGRGVRSNDDYCAVLLTGSKLTARVRSVESEQFLTPATKAQLDLSRKIAKKLKKPSVADLKGVIMQCLNRDPGWIKISKKVLVNIGTDKKLRLDPAKLAIRKALDAARANQYEEALSVLSSAIDEVEEKEEKAWLLVHKASFQHHIDEDGAQKALVKAHSLERNVLKPLIGTSYKKLDTAGGQQAVALVKNHRARFVDPTNMKLFANGLCSDLQFVSVSSDKFEATINDLAMFIGINGHRPEKEFNEGPDNLWALPGGSFLVIECKNGVTSQNGISKSDAGQLGQSVEWFKSKYPAADYVPVIIHPQTVLHQSASLVEGMRVMNEEKMEKLRQAIKKFSQMIENPDVVTSAQEVGKRLAQCNLNTDAFVNSFTSKVKSK